jgi:RHS repeat-associated protein
MCAAPKLQFDGNNNKRNRMASVTRNAVAYGTYVYNGLEQLTSRTSTAPAAPIGAVHYIYDLDGHLIAEATGATGVTTRDYIWMPSNDNQPVDLPLAVAEAATLTHIHTDHLGRPIRMTNAAKATVWQASYKPWGEVQSMSGAQTNNLRFPGQYFQIETTLHYNHHRNYDPVTGRYTQPDPLRFVDGPSVYAYAGNSPYMKTDREGLRVKHYPTPTYPYYRSYNDCAPTILNWLAGATCTPEPNQCSIGEVNMPPFFESAPGNQRDSGLQGVSDADISAGARDRSKSSEERRRYQKEEKARGLRNRTKRNEQQRK